MQFGITALTLTNYKLCIPNSDKNSVSRQKHGLPFLNRRVVHIIDKRRGEGNETKTVLPPKGNGGFRDNQRSYYIFNRFAACRCKAQTCGL